MLSHKAAPFYLAVWNLRKVHVLIEQLDAREEKTAIPDKVRGRMEKHLTALCASLEELEVTGACSVAEVALDDLKSATKATYGKFKERVNSLHQVLLKELSKTELFVLQRADLALFEPKEPLFGEKVDRKFSAARFDIEEAGKCRALGRHTACVYHVMRAAEAAVLRLAKKLRATVANKYGQTLPWGVLTSNIKTEIDALPTGKKKDDWLKIHMFLHACNRAFRTKTAHPGAKYSPDEAREAYEAARTFMRAMADLA
jgi:HEPN domain-containing protein